MVFNSDALIVSLFLYIDEKEWLLQTKNWDLAKAWIFSRIFKFIDDLCMFSNDEFENYCKDIYLDELIIKEEDEDPCQALLLDLLMEVHDRKFTTELVDKRNALPFIQIACSIWMAKYHLKHFMLQSVLKSYVLENNRPA